LRNKFDEGNRFSPTVISNLGVGRLGVPAPETRIARRNIALAIGVRIHWHRLAFGQEERKLGLETMGDGGICNDDVRTWLIINLSHSPLFEISIEQSTLVWLREWETRLVTSPRPPRPRMIVDPD
jgi:hypothetical protein